MVSRTELKTAVKNLPIWEQVSKDYSAKIPRASKGGDFAKCLQDLMEKGTAGKAAYKQCAEKYGISSALSGVWSE
jgi:hypothetical protein